MPQITDIKPQKRKKRFNIFVDGKFAFGLPAETLLGLRSRFGEGGVKAGLVVNQEISQEEIEKLVKENEFAKVYDRVLRFFSYRPRSEKELQTWFSRKQVGEETQKMIWQKLKQLGYLDDEGFAKWWIEQRMTFRPIGSRLLAMELRQKGIPREIIDKLLITNDELLITERAQASKIAQKKREKLKGLSYREAREKLSAFLARRGFSWETIKEVIDSAKRG